MVTKVGLQSDFTAATKDLLELEYDAIEAYEAAISRLSNDEFKGKIEEFWDDHHRHVRDITQALKKHSIEAAEGPSIKQWLTKGKVVIGGLVGDKTILAAMLTNEMDTNSAYDRMVEYEDMWPDAKDVIARARSDEKKHKAWIEQALGYEASEMEPALAKNASKQTEAHKIEQNPG